MEIEQNSKHFKILNTRFQKAPSFITDKKILQVRDIKVSFGKNKVLQGINFDLFQGETLAIVGANGAGKTVLMETIIGLQKKDSGIIKFDFFDEKTPMWKTQKEIGMQFQDASVSKGFKTIDLIKFYKKSFKPKIDNQQLKEMIEVFGVSDFINKKIKKLSGGQKQRANLLLAIMHNPKLMILDEFITGLDVVSVVGIINYVNKMKIKNASSMIIISHQPEEIKNLADRIITMKNGVITGETTPERAESEYGSIINFLLEKI